MIHLALIGPGLVGQAFLAQVAAHQKKSNLLKVIGICNSKKMKLGTLEEYNLDHADPVDMKQFISYCAAHQPCIVIDCTSNQAIADAYSSWVKLGLHIVTPNKKAFSCNLVKFLV